MLASPATPGVVLLSWPAAAAAAAAAGGGAASDAEKLRGSAATAA